MPTVTVDPYQVLYAEIADLMVGEWEEDGTNYLGLSPSHNIRPGYGAQYDPSRQLQYGPYGFRAASGGFYVRSIPEFAPEGPHESGGILVFQPPVGRVTLTSAFVNARWAGLGIDVPWPFRLYGVATDNFVSHFLDVTTGYPYTYRSEFHQAVWGQSARRYRFDSTERDLPHTAAEVRWSQRALNVGDPIQSPDVAPMLNEILARPGWKNGNRLALCWRPDFYTVGVAVAPDLSESAPMLPEGGNGTGGGSPSIDTFTLTLTY